MTAMRESEPRGHDSKTDSYERVILIRPKGIVL